MVEDPWMLWRWVNSLRSTEGLAEGDFGLPEGERADEVGEGSVEVGEVEDGEAVAEVAEVG